MSDHAQDHTLAGRNFTVRLECPGIYLTRPALRSSQPWDDYLKLVWGWRTEDAGRYKQAFGARGKEAKVVFQALDDRGLPVGDEIVLAGVIDEVLLPDTDTTDPELATWSISLRTIALVAEES